MRYRTEAVIDIGNHPASPGVLQKEMTDMEHIIAESPVYLFRHSGKEIVYDRTTTLSVWPDPEKTDRICVSLSVEEADFRVLTLPFRDRDKIERVLPFELEPLVLDGTASVVFDFTPIGTTGDSSENLVVYIRKDLVKRVLGALTARGIDPACVCLPALHGIVGIGSQGITEALLDRKQASEEERIEWMKRDLASPLINLRRGEFSSRKDTEKIGKGLMLTVSLLLALALVLHAGFLASWFTARQAADRISQDMKKTYQTLFPAEKKITDELSRLKSHMKEISVRADIASGVSLLAFLKKLADRGIAGVVIQDMTIGKDIVILKAEAKKTEDIEKAKTVFSGLISDAATTDIKTGPDGKMTFTVTGKGLR